MKKIILLILLYSSFSYAQSNSVFDQRYYHHWETVNTDKSLLEIIIYKNKQTTRVVELDFHSTCDHIGTANCFVTIYVHKKKNGTMAVETINVSTMQIMDSEYVLTKDDKLLRILNNDTLVLKRRY